MRNAIELQLSVRPASATGYVVDLALETLDHPGAIELTSRAPTTLDLTALLAISHAPEQYGQALTDMLFSTEEARRGWERARAFAAGASLPLRVLIHVDTSAASLHGVRWETLHEPSTGQPLARMAEVLLTRSLASLDLAPIPTPPPHKLHALLVGASPNDLTAYGLSPIDVPALLSGLQAALTGIPISTIGDDSRATPGALRAALRMEPDIVYLLCHGTLVDNEAFLWLEQEDGRTERVSGAELVEMISASRYRPSLVVLAACRSAGNGVGSAALSAIGPRLARAGVPAVIAMQGDAPETLVTQLSTTLFHELRQDGRIDRALSAARSALPLASSWWMPALYLRVRDGALWRIEATGPGPRRIFLCYRRHADIDERLARWLDEALRADGHAVFLDQRMIIGTEWAREIDAQIASADALIILLSAQSVTSEMVAREVHVARRHAERAGKPRLLPVRVAYETRTLPPYLEEHLGPLQYALWRDRDDDLPLLSQIRAALAQIAELPSPPLAADVLAEPLAPLPFADPMPLERLSVPGGAVRHESPLYVRRSGDEKLVRQLLHQDDGTLTYIRAPRQCGKSTLLFAGIAQARGAGRRVVRMDLQISGTTDTLASLDALLHTLAANIVRQLRIDPTVVARAWQSTLSPTEKLTYLMEDDILPIAEQGLVLALDEVDRLLDRDYRDAFFGMLRAWFNSRADSPVWQHLHTSLVISTEPYLLIRDPNQSPFNVGLEIRLEDFTAAQVEDLSHQYGIRLTDVQLAELLALLGGHPYLTQMALYTRATEPSLSWDRFITLLRSPESPLSPHIRHYRWRLHEAPDLLEAFHAVLTTGRCPNREHYQRLERVGLVISEGAGRCRPRCGLYGELLGAEP